MKSFLALAPCLALAVTGCSPAGVSQEEYERVVNKNAALKSQIAKEPVKICHK